jgi:hypothetical protein
MPAPASAYAILGLQPGADRAAVEQAYRELIKRYHPDRSGGDAARAAEINQAYFELRRQPQADLSRTRRYSASRRRRRRRRSASRRHRGPALWPVLLIAGAILAILERERLAAAVPRWAAAVGDLRPAPSAGRSRAVAADSAALDGPLDETAIARSIELAIRLVERGDEEALANRSRDCHRKLRADPDLEQLDRCAAFDDAVASIEGRDPMTERGVFSASAITARQMTAASLLSSDYLAIERRLDRIRTVVQLTIRPAPQPAAGQGRGASPVPDEF